MVTLKDVNIGGYRPIKFEGKWVKYFLGSARVTINLGKVMLTPCAYWILIEVFGIAVSLTKSSLTLNVPLILGRNYENY